MVSGGGTGWSPAWPPQGTASPGGVAELEGTERQLSWAAVGAAGRPWTVAGCGRLWSAAQATC